MFASILNRTYLALPTGVRRAVRVVRPSRVANPARITTSKAKGMGFFESWAHLLESQADLVIKSQMED